MKLRKRDNLRGRKIRALIAMLLTVIMVVGIQPLSVSAAAQDVSIKKDVTYYPNGALKSITPTFGWEAGKADATVQLVLMKNKLNSGAEGSYGDFTDSGKYGRSFASYDEAVEYDKENGNVFGIIAASEEQYINMGSKDNELTISLEENTINEDGTYYIYLWTYYRNHFYPDDLLCVVKVSNGRAQYTAATGRNDYNEDNFSAVVSLDLEAVTFAYAYDAQRYPSYPSAADTTMEMRGLDYPLMADKKPGASKEGSWTLSKVGAYADMSGENNSFLESVVSSVAAKYGLNKKAIVIHELKEKGTHVAYGVVISYDVLEGYAVFLGDTWNGGAGYLLSLKEITETTKNITAGTIATDFIYAEAPNVVFTAAGADGGTLTDVDNYMKYQVEKKSGAGAWTDVSVDSVTLTGLQAGDIIRIKRAGDGTTTKDSPLQEITVTQAATPTAPAGVACTEGQQNDGKITGVDITMEYKLLTEDPETEDIWTAVSGDTVTGLSKGTYQVRVKAAGTELASESVEVEIEANEHTHQVTLNAEVAATCEAAGSKAYYSCTCGKYFEDAECTSEITNLETWKVIAAAGHKPNTDDGDCTTAITCSVCGKETTEAKSAHTGGTATCTKKAKCEVCSKEYGELASHTMSATYTSTNADADKHYHICSFCQTKDAGEAHSWNVSEATEETDKHCTVCNYVAAAKLDHVHAGTLVEKVAATCETAGSKTYYSCTCGMYFEDADCKTEIKDLAKWKVIPAAGHTGGTATCTAKAKCDVCGEKYGELAPHTMSADYTLANADAEKHYHICSVCQTKDAGEAHSWNVDKATETTDKYCTVCNYVAEKKSEHVHAGTLNAQVDATCEAAGSKAYYSCTCGKYFEDAACANEITNLETWKVIAAAGHKPNTDDGDCTTAITCSVCGKETNAAKSAHTGGTATCTVRAKCEVCGKEYGELAAHIWDAGTVTRQPTASAQGEKLFTCTAADCKTTKTESIDKLKPSIINGAKGTWTQGGNQGLSFRSDAAVADLLNVSVDGRVVEQKNYTVTSGSIVVELKPEYLATLAVGKHTLAIQSASGSAQTEFTIRAKQAGTTNTNNKKPASTDSKGTAASTNTVKTNAVNTGDNVSPMTWILALAVSFAGIICVTSYGRKHRNR